MTIHAQTIIDRQESLKRELLDAPQCSWSEAVLKNYRFYFTGVPCVRGHISKRSTSDKVCVECKRTRKNYYQPKKKTDLPAAILCGVEVRIGELREYARSGRLPFQVLEKSGLLSPGLDSEIAGYYIREGMDHKTGRVSWGIFQRNCGTRIASFLPGFPRVVSNVKDLYDVACENRRENIAGRVEKLSARQLRDMLERHGMHVCSTRVARDGVPSLAATGSF
jgi:hypothetical protein